MSRNYKPQRMPLCTKHNRTMFRTQPGGRGPGPWVYRCPIDRCPEFALPPLKKGEPARITQSARVAV